MIADFTSLPKTRQERDRSNFVTVPSVDNLDGQRWIFSQEEGEEYLKEFREKYGTIENYNKAAKRYCELKAAWCKANTSE